MYLLAVALWMIDLVNFVHKPTATLIQNPDDPLDSKVDNAMTFLFHLAAIQDMLYSYMVSGLLLVSYPRSPSLMYWYKRRSWGMLSLSGVCMPSGDMVNTDGFLLPRVPCCWAP